MLEIDRTAWRRGRAHAALARCTVSARVETVLLAASLFWLATANRPFLVAALQGRALSEPSTWGFALGLGALLAALNFLLLATVANRWTLKPLLAAMIVVTAVAGHYMSHLGVYLDPSMVRNVVRTNAREAGELLSWSLLLHLLWSAALPLVLLWRLRVVAQPWRRALRRRALAVTFAVATVVIALLALFQPLASLMRNHKETRYLITPANLVWSLGVVAASDMRGAAAPRQAIGLDAAPGPSRPRDIPTVVVLVVGETARAANWGLNGYARQTTPQLARLPVVNFGDVASCGTNTDVSLPCMFAPVGRRHYDEARIRNSESLLHVLARAGVAVHWRDNQSGCKGVCDGLPTDSVQSLHVPGLCNDDGCFDEGLLYGLDERLRTASGTQLLVLHQIGNHGPAYSRRYPRAFARFEPACESDDLRQCTREQIVNAYDNALLYTDHVLANLIAVLQAHRQHTNSALIYVSDHGESLGENNFFLHGLPYALAPDVQTKVPMLLWMSDGFIRAGGLDLHCLHERAAQPASHDHLFHTVLGLLDVRTALYEPAWDLATGCRAAQWAGSAS